MDDALYEGNWVIALHPTGKFLGKVVLQDEDGIRLGPVYEIAMKQVTNPGGAPAVARQLMPVLLIQTDIELGLGNDTATISLRKLDDTERENWFEMVRNVRKGMTQLRAQRAGLHLPTTRQ